MMSIARDANVDVRIGICEKSRVDKNFDLCAIFTIRQLLDIKMTILSYRGKNFDIKK